MTRRFLVVALILTFISGIVSCTQVAPRAEPAVDESPTGRIGVLEHRGKFYRIEDLMDPAYRAASDDPFVKGFMADAHFATPGADWNQHSHLKSKRVFGLIPWAGMHPKPTSKDKPELRLLQRLPRRLDLRTRASGPIPWAGDGPEEP